MRVFERLRQSWRRSMQRRQTLSELAACPPQELNRIASDVGLSGDELRQHCRRDHGASELLPQRRSQIAPDWHASVLWSLGLVQQGVEDGGVLMGFTLWQSPVKAAPTGVQ